MSTTRGLLAWPAGLSLCVACWLIVHSLAYRLIASGDGGAMVERSGHGHVAFSPYLMAASVTVLLVALGAAVAAGAAQRARPTIPLAPFVLLPLLDFIGHVGLESLRHGGELPAGAALEPIFLYGLALQVPFALAALLLARTAMAWAEGFGRGLTPRWRPAPLASAWPAPPRLLIGTEHRPAIPALASGCAQRGPPAASLGH
jgi:hypothetical protein